MMNKQQPTDAPESTMSYLPMMNEDYRLMDGQASSIADSQQFLQHLLDQSPVDASNLADLKSDDDNHYANEEVQFLNRNTLQDQNDDVFYPGPTTSDSHFSNAYHARTSFSDPPTCQGNSMYHGDPHGNSGVSLSSSQQLSNKVAAAVSTQFNYDTRSRPHSSHSQSLSNSGNHASFSALRLSSEPLPDTTSFPGPFNFQLCFGAPTDGATKSIDYTYSHRLQKLFVQRGVQCPFKFKTTRRPPGDSYIKALPVFKGTHVLSEPVRRCSNHAESDEDANARYHFVRSNNASANYETSESGRLYVTLPYNGPQVGAEYQIELLTFTCFNSCGNSSHAKRRIDIIFTLENDGKVLGRQVFEARVCACPGRDRTTEELPAGVPRRRRAGSASTRPKRRKLSGLSTRDTTYTITTSQPNVYNFLVQIQNLIDNYFGDPRTALSPTSSCSTNSPASALAIDQPSSEEDEN